METNNENGWEPIETAPRHWDIAILVVDVRKPPNGLYDNDNCIRVVFWDDDDDEWTDGQLHYNADQFTHWMPLPERPDGLVQEKRRKAMEELAARTRGGRRRARALT